MLKRQKSSTLAFFLLFLFIVVGFSALARATTTKSVATDLDINYDQELADRTFDDETIDAAYLIDDEVDLNYCGHDGSLQDVSGERKARLDVNSLNEVNLNLKYGGDGDDLQDFYAKFKAQPNVNSLDVWIWGTGCTVRQQDRSFDIGLGDKLPPIKKLKIQGYEFQSRPESWYRKAEARIQGEAGLTNLDRWVKVMNFSKLEELNLPDQEEYFCERMKHELPGLRALSVRWDWRGTPSQYLDFISEVGPLTNLSIEIGAPWIYPHEDNYYDAKRPSFPLEQILKKHGPTLQSLDLHQRESEISFLRRPMFSLNNISSIKTSCPQLVHLGIDIDRNGTWPNETLDALMELPNLTSLSLGLEIGADLHVGEPGDYGWNPEGLSGNGPWREPRVLEDVPVELFKYLRSKKVGAELTSLTITVGDLNENDPGSALYFPSWQEGRGRRFTCWMENTHSPSEKDEKYVPVCYMRSRFPEGHHRISRQSYFSTGFGWLYDENGIGYRDDDPEFEIYG